MFTRWFSPSSVCADGLFTRLREGDPELHVEFRKTGHYVIGIVGTVLIVTGVLLGLGFAANEHSVNQVRLIKATVMVLSLAVVGGALAGWIVSRHNRRLVQRVLAFDAAVEKHDFANCGNVKLEDAYKLPLVYEETLPDCPGKTLRAWLCGRWNEDEFAWLQGSHLNDPVFRGKDTGLISGILRVLFGRQANKGNRVRRMHYETIVFAEELPLPDVILGHSHIGVTSYLKRELKRISQPLQGVPLTRLLVWGATSDSRGTVGLYDQLVDLFDSRTCLIQVISGRVVVFLNYSHGSLSKRIKSVEDVEHEIDFAYQIFQRLKLVAQAQSPVEEQSVSYESAARERRVELFRERAVRNKQRAHRHVSGKKALAGLAIMCLAFITGSGSLMLIRKHPDDIKIQHGQRSVLLGSIGVGGLGLLLTAYGAGFLRLRERGRRNDQFASMVSASEARDTGLSSAKYFQNSAS